MFFRLSSRGAKKKHREKVTVSETLGVDPVSSLAESYQLFHVEEKAIVSCGLILAGEVFMLLLYLYFYILFVKYFTRDKILFDKVFVFS